MEDVDSDDEPITESHNSTTASQEEKKSDSENDDYVNPAYKRRKKRNLAKKRLLRTGIAAYREPGTILDPAELAYKVTKKESLAEP